MQNNIQKYFFPIDNTKHLSTLQSMESDKKRHHAAPALPTVQKLPKKTKTPPKPPLNGVPPRVDRKIPRVKQGQHAAKNPKIGKAELLRRVEIVTDGLLAGQRRSQILRTVNSKPHSFGVSARQVDRYIQIAGKRIERRVELDRRRQFSMATGRILDLYHRAIKQKSLKVALACQHELNSLYRLNERFEVPAPSQTVPIGFVEIAQGDDGKIHEKETLGTVNADDHEESKILQFPKAANA
jgi:hypothetical protein